MQLKEGGRTGQGEQSRGGKGGGGRTIQSRQSDGAPVGMAFVNDNVAQVSQEPCKGGVSWQHTDVDHVRISNQQLCTLLDLRPLPLHKQATTWVM